MEFTVTTRPKVFSAPASRRRQPPEFQFPTRTTRTPKPPVRPNHGTPIAHPPIPTIALLLCCTLLSHAIILPQTTQATAPAKTLASAVAEYQAGMGETERSKRIQHFHRAELLFRRLTKGTDGNSAGIRNPDLFVDQGNAALQAQRLGPAILAYRRALLIDPDHDRAQQNLAQARGLLPQWIRKNDSDQLFNTFFGWLNRLSIDERFFYAGLCFFAVTLLAAASIRWRSMLLRSAAMIPLLAWLVLLGSAVFSMLQESSAEAIVTVPETVARSADSPTAPPRFREPLPSGTEVEILEARSNWLRVQLSGGRDAWLPTSSVTRISLRRSASAR